MFYNYWSKIFIPVVLTVFTLVNITLFADELSGSTDSIRIRSIDAGMSVAFAIETSNGLYLVDAGSPGKERKIFKQLRSFSSKELKLIIITHAHFDHYGNADALRRMTGAKIAISGADAPFMAAGQTPLDSVRSWGRLGKMVLPLAEKILKPKATTADIALVVGQTLDSLGLPAVVIGTPGHTVGSISIILKEEIAFVSDLIVTHPRKKAQCYYASNWSQINYSMEKIAAHDFKRVYAGHSRKSLSIDKFRALIPDRQN